MANMKLQLVDKLYHCLWELVLLIIKFNVLFLANSLKHITRRNYINVACCIVGVSFRHFLLQNYIGSLKNNIH